MPYLTFFQLTAEHTRLMVQFHERLQINTSVRVTSDERHEQIVDYSRARITRSKVLLAKPVHVPLGSKDLPLSHPAAPPYPPTPSAATSAAKIGDRGSTST